MDVVPYTELQDFIDSLDVKDRKVEIESVRVEEKDDICVGDTEVEERRQVDVWQNIADAANDWSRRLVDAECLHARSTDFRSTVESSLYRQQLDGFLSIHDVGELRYTTDLWVELLNSLSSYLVGCVFLKRNVISLLLKLYSVKQISEELFIETCFKL
jgi:hypothetical protein